MTTIHPEYGGEPALVPFDGTIYDLKGGEYLGITARPELLEPGDLVTVPRAHQGHYYYDPRLVIEGTSYVRVPGDWLRINRDNRDS